MFSFIQLDTEVLPEFKDTKLSIPPVLLIKYNSTFCSNLLLSFDFLLNNLDNIYSLSFNLNIIFIVDGVPFGFLLQIIEDENCLLFLEGIDVPNNPKHITSRKLDLPNPFSAFNNITLLFIFSKSK